MIKIPCNCGAEAVLPVDDSSPICPNCKQKVTVCWFYSKGKSGTKSYQGAFDVWRASLLRTGRVARSA